MSGKTARFSKRKRIGGDLATATVEPPTNDDIDESSREESLPADTSQSPPSIWSRSGPSEPSFGVSTGEANSETAQSRSRVRDYQPSLAERVQEQINRKKGIPTPRGRPLNWAQRSAVRRQTTAKAAQKVSATALRVLGKAGGRAAGVVLGNVVGAAIAVALTLKDISDLFWKRIEGSEVTSVILGALVAFGLLGIITFFSLSQSKNHNGPDISGATANQNIDSQELAGLASGEYSIISATSVADLQKIRQRLNSYLQGNTNSNPDARNRASILLAQMNDIEKSIKTSAFASDKSVMAKHVQAYQKLVNDFYTIVLPNGGTIRAQLTDLVNSGVIRTNHYCSGVDRDLRGTGKLLTPALMNSMVEIGKFATANGLKIEISCLNSGHKRGKGVFPSRHVIGQALDIQYHAGDNELPSKLLPFLWDNRERLQLAEIIFNVPVNGQAAGFYNYKFTSPSLNRTTYASDHRTHIHISTRQ